MNLSAASQRLSRIAGFISAAEWAAAGVTMFNDQGSAGAINAGTYNLSLAPTSASTASTGTRLEPSKNEAPDPPTDLPSAADVGTQLRFSENPTLIDVTDSVEDEGRYYNIDVETDGSGQDFVQPRVTQQSTLDRSRCRERSSKPVTGEWVWLNSLGVGMQVVGVVVAMLGVRRLKADAFPGEPASWRTSVVSVWSLASRGGNGWPMNEAELSSHSWGGELLPD